MQMPSDIKGYQARANRYVGDRGPWLEHLVEDEGLSFDEAAHVLGYWECIPYIDPKYGHMATLLKRNKEVHFAWYRRFRRKGHITAARIRSFLQPILDREIYLVTKLGRDEPRAFIEHLGFQQLGSTIDGTTTFILNEIKYPGV